MNLFMKGLVCVALLIAICLCPATGRLLAVKARAASPDEAAVATQAQTGAIPHDIDSGKHLMQWGVLLYGVGEVGTLVGMGICNIRREKRRELQAQEKRIATDAGALLLYSEYKDMLKTGAVA